MFLLAYQLGGHEGPSKEQKSSTTSVEWDQWKAEWLMEDWKEGVDKENSIMEKI